MSLPSEQREALKELIRRREQRDRIFGLMFDLQQEVVQCEARYIALLCGRRSGKTQTLKFMIALALLAAGQNERVGYASASRKLSKELIWSELKALLLDLGCTEGAGWRILENEGTIETPRGAIFQLFGFDDIPSLEKARGFKFVLFCMDEIKDVPQEHVERIVDESVGPALMDCRGKLVVAGTPGRALTGWWWRVSTGQDPAFERVFHWTVRENKKFPRDPEEAIQEELKLKNWTENTPRFRREILAEWVAETSELVWSEYRAETNKRPRPADMSGWSFAIGIDYGTTDPTAWVVVGAGPNSPVAYVVETRSERGLPPEQVSNITKALVERYRPVGVYGDVAARGYIEDFNTRWGHILGCWVQGCKKIDKPGQIDVVNDLWRQGHLVLAGDHPELEHEIATWLWEDREHTKTPKKADDHLSDALRYVVISTQTSHRAPPPEIPPDPLADFERRARAELDRRDEDARWRDWDSFG